jgi:hypothetical protein
VPCNKLAHALAHETKRSGRLDDSQQITDAGRAKRDTCCDQERFVAVDTDPMRCRRRLRDHIFNVLRIVYM